MMALDKDSALGSPRRTKVGGRGEGASPDHVQPSAAAPAAYI